MQPIDTDVPIRGEVRRPGHRRVSHGLFVVDRPELNEDAEFRRDLHALLLVMPDGAVYTGLTGARLMNWTLPDVKDRVPYFAAVHEESRHPRRPGLLCSRLVKWEVCRDGVVTEVDGLPVDLPEEILLRCARDVGHLDLVRMIDSALRRGDVDPDRMAAILASRRPGVRALRAAYEAADGRAECGGDTLLRRFHDVMDVPVEPQETLTDPDGRPIGRAALLVTGTRWVHEYDDAADRGGEQHRSDLRWDRRLTAAGYVRCGYTLDDLTHHPGTVMHELDRLLGRPHDLERLRRWRSMVAGSTFSEEGRERLLNRWRRQMGIDDWVA